MRSLAQKNLRISRKMNDNAGKLWRPLLHSGRQGYTLGHPGPFWGIREGLRDFDGFEPRVLSPPMAYQAGIGRRAVTFTIIC